MWNETMVATQNLYFTFKFGLNVFRYACGMSYEDDE
jgi:hypothetical protein